MPSASPISVSVRPPNSMRRCQSALLRASARDLKPKHEADVGEGDFGGEPGKTRSRDKARAGEPEVLIDDLDAIGGPAEFTGFGGKRILSIGRLAIVLDLGGAGLAQVDDRLTREMASRDLGALIHRFPPSSIWSRACER